MDRLSHLIEELSALIDVPLQLDHRRICSLRIDHSLLVELKEEENDRLLIATFLGEMAPGKFRETLFKEALKENDSLNRIGTLCYVERNNQMALFTYRDMEGLRGDLLADTLEPFLERAFAWRRCLDTGEIPPRGR